MAIMSPITAPAIISLRVIPFKDFNEIRVTAMAAAAKRSPTNIIGLLKFSPYCTVIKLPPQIRVIRIKASCGSLAARAGERKVEMRVDISGDRKITNKKEVRRPLVQQA